MNHKTHIAIAVLAAALLAAAVAVYPLWPGKERIDQSGGKRTFVYELDNFKFDVPAGWTEIPSSSVELPQSFSDSQFAFAQEKMGCVVAYARMPAVNSYRSVSYETVSTTENEHLNPYWYVQGSQLSGDVMNATNARRPFIGEVLVQRFPLVGDRADLRLPKVFILLKHGDAVPQRCTDGFLAMLGSLADEFQPASISSSTDGIVYIQSRYKSPAQIVFRPEGDPVARLLMEVQDGTYQPFQVADGKLYAESQHGISRIDIVEKRVVPLVSVPGNQSIVSFYPDGQHLYYTKAADYRSADCFGEDCSFSLYDFNQDTGDTAMLQEDIIYSTILSFVPGSQRLYVMNGYGDAGCFSARANYYDVIAGGMGTEKSFGGCDGDFESQASPGSTAYHAFLKQIGGELAYYNFIPIHAGQIAMPATSTDSIPAGAFQIVYRP